ncbi:MAG TPA: YIP1 family protein [Bryobacteraceae bacterium]|nr:YIP1 family protein [Bryobacteraceae bacterium]
MTEPQVSLEGMGELKRLAGVFWEPKPVFEELAARPRWWVPLIFLTVLALVYIGTFSRVIGWDTFIRQQFETNPRLQSLSSDQRAQAMEMQMKIGSRFAYVGGALGMTVSSLVIAGILFGAFNLLGGASLKFKQAFSITCYSLLPTALSSILALIVMLFKNPEDFDLQNPLVLNVGAFLDPAATPKALHSLATSLDLFSIWVILLLALGFSVAARRISYAKSLILVLVPWALYVAGKSGWAAMFG